MLIACSDDVLGSDEIGKTTIDLEDRFFDSRWRALGETAGGQGLRGRRILKPVRI